MDARARASGSERMRLIALLLLLMFAGAASATDYYVATWGDNTTQGNITHPWQNVSYATQHVFAGDTIHLFDGVWYGEYAVFANAGNATHQITLTAYNGTPEMDGLSTTYDGGYGVSTGGNDYINIDGLEIHHYHHTIYLRGSDHCKVSNCILHDTGGTLPSGQYGGAVIEMSLGNDTYKTLENCTLYNSGWNTIQLYGNREPPDGSGIPATHITIRNCTVHASHKHAAIDIYGNHQYVLIEDCAFYNNTHGYIYSHHAPDHTEYLTIHNNSFDGLGTTQIGVELYDGPVHDVIISNNTFVNFTGAVIHVANSHNYTVKYNEIDNCTLGPRFDNAASYNITFNKNNINSDSGRYLLAYGAGAIIKNPLGGMKDIELTEPSSEAELLFEDGTVFTAIHSWLFSYVPVRYYPANSNTSGVARTDYGGTINTVTSYNITLAPTNAYLKDVTVNHESDASDDRTNITANSSVSDNPTTITATMQNASHTYNVSIDGVYDSQVVSNAAKVAQYQYSSAWSSHHFEFDWYSGGAGAPTYTPPTIATLTSTTGSTWVRHSWSPGSGNVTDSYNVSVNSVWHNGTTNAYYQDTYLPGEWQNITIYAYNSSGAGTLSTASLSQNTQLSGIIEDYVNPSFVSSGAAAILFVAASGRFVISAWRNRRRTRRN